MALDELAPGRVTGWAAYPAGVAWALGEAGYEVPGAWLAFESDLPAGAGLSSSAALECATALALTELALTGLALTGPADRRELAVLASRAENEFAGVPSGLMDQPRRCWPARARRCCWTAGRGRAPWSRSARRRRGPGAADRHQGPARAG